MELLLECEFAGVLDEALAQGFGLRFVGKMRTAVTAITPSRVLLWAASEPAHPDVPGPSLAGVASRSTSFSPRERLCR